MASTTTIPRAASIPRRTSIPRFLRAGVVTGALIAASAAWAGDHDLAPAARSLDRREGPSGRLGAAVRFARSVALDRVARRPECREMFERRGADGARLLQSAAYQVAAPGDDGGERCERSVAAFTRMSTDQTWLCGDNFSKLSRHEGAVVLLHEALHVAGMGEAPHHPGALTVREIDRMVKRRCGL